MGEVSASTEGVTDRVRALIGGRPVVVVTVALSGAARLVESLRDLGARDVLVLALTRGTGPVPRDTRTVLLPPRPMDGIAGEIAAMDELVNRPSPQARRAVSTFDPTGEALVHIGSFTRVDGDFLGRRTVGGRPRQFEALEDKTRCAALWDAADVTHAGEMVVRCDRAALTAATTELDLGGGTVWSADASHGFNGGAERVHRVDDQLSFEAALAALAPVADHVRVMPFLEGVPCSIHGLVLPDGIAVLRPVELAVLRRESDKRFVYSGCGTGWDPSPFERDTMRAVAAAVGATLARDDGYRGAFGVDGILTERGFRPTELNPRFSGGISTIAKGVPDLPIGWIHQLATAGMDVGIGAEPLERLLLAGAQKNRFAAALTQSPRSNAQETTTIEIADDDAELPAGILEHGPGTHGDLVRYTPHSMPPGTRLAPLAVAAFRRADRLWDTGFGVLMPAPDVSAA